MEHRGVTEDKDGYKYSYHHVGPVMGTRLEVSFLFCYKDACVCVQGDVYISNILLFPFSYSLIY